MKNIEKQPKTDGSAPSAHRPAPRADRQKRSADALRANLARRKQTAKKRNENNE